MTEEVAAASLRVKVVSQFEIFAAVRRRPFALRFPERWPPARPLFDRAKPLHGPATARFRTFRAAFDVAVDLRLAMRASCELRTDRSFGTVRLHSEQSFRGGPRLDDREPATGPCSLVAQHRDHHARRSVEDLPVQPGLLAEVFPFNFRPCPWRTRSYSSLEGARPLCRRSGPAIAAVS